MLSVGTTIATAARLAAQLKNSVLLHNVNRDTPRAPGQRISQHVNQRVARWGTIAKAVEVHIAEGAGDQCPLGLLKRGDRHGPRCALRVPHNVADENRDGPGRASRETT